MRDVVVVGGGIVGVAIAHALAVAGVRTTLLERATLAAGATGHSGAMVRAFHVDDRTVDLALRSLPTWQGFDRAVGGSCGFVRAGSLYTDRVERRAAIDVTAARIAAAGQAIAVLGAAAAREQFQAFTFGDDDLAIAEPDAGFVDPRMACQAYATAARRQGSAIAEGHAVEGLVVNDGQVAGVSTAAGFVPAAVVVLAAGAAAGALVAPLGLELPMENKVIQLQRVSAGGDLPCFLDRPTVSYGRRDGLGGTWVGMAPRTTATTPGEQRPDGDMAYEAVDLAGRRVATLADREIAATVCTTDAYGPDRWGWQGWLAPRGLYVATGFGGTGLKIAPALGADVAAAVLASLAAGVVS